MNRNLSTHMIYKFCVREYEWSLEITLIILHFPKWDQAYLFQPGKPLETEDIVEGSSIFFSLLMSLMTDGGLTSMAGSFPGTSSDVPEFDREVELETSRGVLSPCGPSMLSWLDDADAFRFFAGEPEWAGKTNKEGNEFVFCSNGGCRCCEVATGRPGPLETQPEGKNTPVPVLGTREGGRGLGMTDHGAWGTTAVGEYVLKWFTATVGKSGFKLEFGTDDTLGRTWATPGSLTVGTGSTPEMGPKTWGFILGKPEPLALCVGM
jgi:hypothetical protein